MIVVTDGKSSQEFVYELFSEKNTAGILRIYGKPGFSCNGMVAENGICVVSGVVQDGHILVFPDLVLPDTQGYYIVLVFVDDGDGYYVLDMDDLYIKNGEGE